MKNEKSHLQNKQLRKVISIEFPIALSSLKRIYGNSILLSQGRDAISFYDCLCKTEPQILPAKALALLWYSRGHHPLFRDTRGHLTFGRSHPFSVQLYK